jgi:hypothetical protein
MSELSIFENVLSKQFFLNTLSHADDTRNKLFRLMVTLGKIKEYELIVTAKGIKQIKQNKVLFVQCYCGMN